MAKAPKKDIDFEALKAVELRPDAWEHFESEVKGKLKAAPHDLRDGSLAASATAGTPKPSA